jgi:hypothetical protein
MLGELTLLIQNSRLRAARRRRLAVSWLKRRLLFGAYLALGAVAVAFGGTLSDVDAPAVTGTSQRLESAGYKPVQDAGNTFTSDALAEAPDHEPLAAPGDLVSERGPVTGSTAPPRSKKVVVAPKSRIPNVNITFYDCKEQGFCGDMYNGRKVYQGAAACSWNLPIGTRFIIIGDTTRRTYTCEDRGLLDDTWVDVFWNNPRDGWKWQNLVGRHGTIEIVSLPR